MNVTGTWHGEYVYGPNYGPLAKVAVPWTMSLTDSWLRGVVGYVRDDASKGGMPERGRVRGFRRRFVLRFEKTMPNNYGVDASGALVDVREFYRVHHGIHLAADLPPHRIWYRGRIATDGHVMKGTWTIDYTMPSDRGHLPCQGTGTWSARRTSDLPSEV